MNYGKRFRVKPGSQVNLDDVDPDFKDKHANQDDARTVIEKDALRLRELQELMYAEHKHSLLICLQGMDAGGKDGTIRHVLGSMNPQGCRAVSFKQPTHIELDHDFLWRIHRNVPGRGEVVIFNRSHYEDVLVARVHNLVPKKSWSQRYDQINAFEELLTQNGTHILKFFLHISKDEQLQRFKDRLDDPTKQWKISLSDYSERKRWDDYVEAYEEMLSRCSTAHAPWFIVPANHKWFRNLVVARITVACLEDLDMRYPPPSVDLELIRKEFHQEEKEA